MVLLFSKCRTEIREMPNEKLKGQKVKFFDVPEPSLTYPKVEDFCWNVLI
ncbi:hypothetical protein JHK87_049703 [Glycine soja]|nr:hypothetical protein JHK87_049703 [Glycine soja]